MRLAFERQQFLWKGYKPTNEQSHKRHLELILEGHTVNFEGKLCGPYIESVTCTYSNGETLLFYNLTSLFWAANVLEIY